MFISLVNIAKCRFNDSCLVKCSIQASLIWVGLKKRLGDILSFLPIFLSHVLSQSLGKVVIIIGCGSQKSLNGAPLNDGWIRFIPIQGFP